VNYTPLPPQRSIDLPALPRTLAWPGALQPGQQLRLAQMSELKAKLIAAHGTAKAKPLPIPFDKYAARFPRW
jgi:hypothetical protein